MTLSEFIRGAGSDPVIRIETDASCRMARVLVGGVHAMEGNAWDFHGDCHGGWHRELAQAHGGYRSPEGMAVSLAAAVAAEGGRATLSRGAYAYRG